MKHGGRGRDPVGNAGLVAQALVSSTAGVIPYHQDSRREDLHQDVDEQGLERRRARAGGLQHHGVGVPVGEDAGQQVGLAVDDTERVGAGKRSLAPFESVLNSFSTAPRSRRMSLRVMVERGENRACPRRRFLSSRTSTTPPSVSGSDRMSLLNTHG